MGTVVYLKHHQISILYSRTSQTSNGYAMGNSICLFLCAYVCVFMCAQLQACSVARYILHIHNFCTMYNEQCACSVVSSFDIISTLCFWVCAMVIYIANALRIAFLRIAYQQAILRQAISIFYIHIAIIRCYNIQLFAQCRMSRVCSVVSVVLSE